MKTRNGEKTDGVSTTRTTFELVECLSKMGEATLSELTKETGLAKSTVLKHLRTLGSYSYVVRKDDRYRIGYNFLTVGGAARDKSRFFDTVRPRLHSLADSTGLMVLFAILENGEGVFLYRLNDQLGLGKAIPTGLRFELYQNAAGKAMLSECTNETVEELLGNRDFNKLTDRTVADRKTLYSRLEEIRDRGYAINMGERKERLWAVASPINNPETGDIGAVSVSGPASQLTEDRLHDLGPEVVGVVDELQLQLQYQ